MLATVNRTELEGELDGLQSVRPSLPGWKYVGKEGRSNEIDATPPTAEEWAWIVENRRLILSAVRRCARFAYGYAAVGGSNPEDDLISFLAPTVVSCLRGYKEDMGSFANYLFRAMRNAVATGESSVIGGRTDVVRQPRNRRAVPTVLLGDEGENLPDPRKERWEEDADAEEAQAVKDRLLKRLQSSVRIKERNKELFADFVGLKRERMNEKSLIEKYGLTRTRIYQIVGMVLLDLTSTVRPVEKGRITLNRARAAVV